MANRAGRWRLRVRDLFDQIKPAESEMDRNVSLIADSGLFNAEIYSQVSGATGSETELIRHFLAAGAADVRTGGAPQANFSRVASFYNAMAERGYHDMAAANWIGPEIAFGLMYPFLSPGQTIADFGVGTGLSAISFERAGCKVVGIDASTEMLEFCRQLDVCTELFQHDLGVSPYPLNDATADHALSTGVLHFIPDLNVFAAEAARIVRPGGALYLDVVNILSGMYPAPRWGFATTARLKFHLHGQADVVASLRAHGFEVLKSCPFFFVEEIFQTEHGTEPARCHFHGYLARKVG